MSAARLIVLVTLALTLFSHGCTPKSGAIEPLGFRFVDAVSGEPIQGVEVRAARRASREAFSEQADGARTGRSGNAMLNLNPAPFIDVLVRAPNYQRTNFELERSREGLSLNGIPSTLAIPVDPTQDASFGSALAWRVALVPDPPLEFRLIVPNDFRGMIRVVYPPVSSDPAPGLQGTRDTPRSAVERDRFVIVDVTDDGYAFLPDTWMINTQHSFSAVRDSGERILGPEGAMARGKTELEVRLRGGIDLLRSDFFVVGSLREYERALAQHLGLDR